jgi:hypothetical protein
MPIRGKGKGPMRGEKKERLKKTFQKRKKKVSDVCAREEGCG